MPVVPIVPVMSLLPGVKHRGMMTKGQGTMAKQQGKHQQAWSDEQLSMAVR